LSSSRFRPFRHAHFINPVLYAEFENINGADKIMKEVEGHDVESDFLTPNEESRKEHKHEMELKLILSTNYKGVELQNTIAVKNLTNEPWEFGYALGASRPLALKASSHTCTFCPQTSSLGLRYTVAWETDIASDCDALLTTSVRVLRGICRRVGRFELSPPSGWTVSVTNS
jgi:hypothetical protein